MWSFIRGKFGKKTPMRPCPKNAEFYYNGRRVFVAATYFDSLGFVAGGPPMKLLTRDAEAIALGTAIHEGLSASSVVSDDERLRYVSLMLDALGIDQEALERDWDKIDIWLDDTGEVVVAPVHRYDSGGWGGDDDLPIFHCPLEPEAIGEAIRRVLDGEPPSVLRTCPSHT